MNFGSNLVHQDEIPDDVSTLKVTFRIIKVTFRIICSVNPSLCVKIQRQGKPKKQTVKKSFMHPITLMWVLPLLEKQSHVQKFSTAILTSSTYLLTLCFGNGPINLLCIQSQGCHVFLTASTTPQGEAVWPRR
ncbi:hypothetical protein AWC38_SpisGene25776 [Stylophora pistillata]|uniref:Uncharacterized protein n=1 Tax=Stylophora pistillata TaxID=50429 RepID=A0A2B4RF90_STYPI|nr:hypothetical protein AWC38_SpisGene25776 [Stylophora pistillata]